MSFGLKKILTSDDLSASDFRELMQSESNGKLSIHTTNVIWRKYLDFERKLAKDLKRLMKEGEKLAKEDWYATDDSTRRPNRPRNSITEAIPIQEPSGPLSEHELAQARELVTLTELPLPSHADYSIPLQQVEMYDTLGLVSNVQPADPSNWLLTGEEELLTYAAAAMGSVVDELELTPLPETLQEQVPNVEETLHKTPTRSISRPGTSNISGRERITRETTRLQQELEEWALLPREVAVPPRRRGVKRKATPRAMKLISYASYYLQPLNPEALLNYVEPYPMPSIYPFLMEQLKQMQLECHSNRVEPQTEQPFNVTAAPRVPANSVVTTETLHIQPSSVIETSVRTNIADPGHSMEIDAIEAEASIAPVAIPPIPGPLVDTNSMEDPILVPPAIDPSHSITVAVENIDIDVPTPAEVSIPIARAPITPHLPNHPIKYSTPLPGSAGELSMADISKVRDMSNIAYPEIPSMMSAQDDALLRSVQLDPVPDFLGGQSEERIQFVRETLRELKNKRHLTIAEIMPRDDNRLNRAWKLGLLTEMHSSLWYLDIDKTTCKLLGVKDQPC